MEKNKFPKRVMVKRAPGMTSFKLSKIVAELPTLNRAERHVLRAMCDRYPNIWTSVEKIAKESGYEETWTRKQLRNLEQKQLIGEIPSPSGKSRKQGGRGCSVQYGINVKRVLDHLVEKGDSPNPTLSEENPTLDEQNPTLSEGNPTLSEPKPDTQCWGTENRTEKRTEKRNQPTQPEPRNEELDGRLAEKLAMQFHEDTGDGFSPTDKEIVGINAIMAEHSEEEIADGFHFFLNRKAGFQGVVRPLSLFIKEAETWINIAQKEREELEEQGVLPRAIQPVQRLENQPS